LFFFSSAFFVFWWSHESSREKSSDDDAFHSFFVSFGLKHFASLLYTQKDKYNLPHTLRAIESEE
jgi:hypothetical protein